MNADKKEIVLNTSDEAAKPITGISGWVDRHGRFWGTDERMARWSGATHIACELCGVPIEKTRLICGCCWAKRQAERYANMPKKEHAGEPLYSDTTDHYFWSVDELDEYCFNNETTPERLKLIICEPVYAKELNPGDIYADDLPEDGEIDDEIEVAFITLNAAIRACKTPLSWMPGKYAAMFSNNPKGETT
jgi:hypothetical protein